MKKYPVLEPTAFILIGLVGVILVYEESYHAITGGVLHIPSLAKLGGILSVVALALLYSGSAGARRLIDPLMGLAFPLMKGCVGLVSLIMLPLTLLMNTYKARRKNP